MKHLFTLTLAVLAIASCASNPEITWTEGEGSGPRGTVVNTITIHNAPKGNDWAILYMNGRGQFKPEDMSQAEISQVYGPIYQIRPAAGHDSEISVSYRTRELRQQSGAPQDFLFQRDGKKPVRIKTNYVFQPVESVKSFDYTPVEVAVTDMVPALKRVNAGCCEPADSNPGWYRITVKDGKFSIESNDADGEYYAGITIENLKRNAAGAKIEDMVIEDWPDMPMRGLMLDVARNFTSKDNVLRLLDIMAHYKANVFHLHFGDDEGWRIEIPGIPELTSYGAFRVMPQLQPDGTYAEVEALKLAYCSSAGKDDKLSSGNGFYSKKDFIEILKYAAARHITVVPEFDTPGHARAAIKSVEKYYQRTGDASYLLTEAADSSKYVSVQGYNDNVINVALPSTYKFIEKVIDELMAMYEAAGLKLEIMHIGGDEVPEHCWDRSPACQELMAQNGWTSPDRLSEYYFSKVLDIVAERGVKLAGWQELALHITPETEAKLKANLAYTNIWNVRENEKLDEAPYQYANQGIPVILSNSNNTYADMAYNYGKNERGAGWSGYVDERRAFSLLPYDIYRSVRWDDRCRIKDIASADAGKTVLTAPENILGIQAQLWTETIRNFDHVTYYFFPKIVGLFERGWNASPAWEGSTVSDDPRFVADFNRFYSIIVEHEMPYYDKLGICYHPEVK